MGEVLVLMSAEVTTFWLILESICPIGSVGHLKRSIHPPNLPYGVFITGYIIHLKILDISSKDARIEMFMLMLSGGG